MALAGDVRRAGVYPRQRRQRPRHRAPVVGLYHVPHGLANAPHAAASVLRFSSAKVEAKLAHARAARAGRQTRVQRMSTWRASPVEALNESLAIPAPSRRSARRTSPTGAAAPRGRRQLPGSARHVARRLRSAVARGAAGHATGCASHEARRRGRPRRAEASSRAVFARAAGAAAARNLPTSWDHLHGLGQLGVEKMPRVHHVAPTSGSVAGGAGPRVRG